MKRFRSTMRRATVAASLVAAIMLVAASTASAFSIDSFSVTSTSSTAGAHPDLTTELAFSTVPREVTRKAADGNLRDLIVDLPSGLVGDPQAVPQCSQGAFANYECPAAAQVGVAKSQLIFPNGVVFPVTVPVFNMEPRDEEETAEIAFSILKVITIHAEVAVRTDGDYGLTTTSSGISRQYGVAGVALTLWGVPADPGHDPARTDMEGNPVPPTGLPRIPFLTNPTTCQGPMSTGARADSYQQPGVFSSATAQMPQQTGCDRVPFAPELRLAPTSAVAGVPSGFESILTLPQSNSPDGLASSSLRNAVITLPQGVAVNASSATGLGGCDDASLKLGTTEAAACPDDAKIGTVEFDVPVFPRPIQGEVYLRKPEPGNLLRIALVADQFGVHLKIPGTITTDPQTGQLTATFTDTPQVPLSSLHLRLNGGPRAPLMTPSRCGTYTTRAELTSWSGKTVVSDSSFTIGNNEAGQCGPGFEPGLSAGTESPTAGAFSPFDLRLTRSDSSKQITGLTASLPPGLLGSLKGIPYCPDPVLASISGDEGTGQAQIDHPSCPAASQIGTVTVGAGAGSNPFYTTQGRAYLAGPYKGAPLSLAVVTPAVAGPFDLGNVVVRNALMVDPATTKITAVSDPIPTIMHGIPLDIRDIRVELGRPGFTLNPTSCEPMAVDATVGGSEGASAALTNRFQVGDCASLGFKPSLALRFKGQTKRTGNPAITATLKAPEGQANIAKTTVILPKSSFIDQSHVNNPCTRVQFAANACPAKSILGTAVAYTPLLDKPLEGPVYFRSNGGERQLPDLVADLNGQIHVTLVGFIDSVKVGKEGSRVRTRFLSVPDAPVSKFVLKLKGGKRGLIENSQNLCKTRPKARVRMTGQNGKVHDFKQRISTRCKKAKHHKPAKHKRAA